MGKEGFSNQMTQGRAAKEPPEAQRQRPSGQVSAGAFEEQGQLLRFTSALASWGSRLSIF